MDEVRIGSSSMVHTPGIIPYIQNIWKTKPSLATDMLASMGDAPVWVIPQLLAGDYVIEGETVVVRKNNGTTTPLTDLEQTRPGTRRRRS